MLQNNPQAFSFISLGGIEDVTKNMYLYEYGNEILVVDCGVGFADETMLGVDLLLPDVSYLLKETKAEKRIVGMLLSHGHEDHIGALPFVLPQLPRFPIFATPFTAALANQKLQDFQIEARVKPVSFGSETLSLGSFSFSFIHVTHSIPDTAHIVINTPVGTIYHGSDFKFEQNPYDGKLSDTEKIKRAGEAGVLLLVSDCLGAERKGESASEQGLKQKFVEIIRSAKGKVLFTTYSSHVNRINQVLEAARITKRKVCFVGKSLQRVKLLASDLGYLHLKDALEVPLDGIKRYKDDELVFIVAGSQAQETSAMMRIANDEHRDILLTSNDTVVFSSDIIPGNELIVYGMIDMLAKKGVRVLYKDIEADLHVSGHGNGRDLVSLLQYTMPKYVLPISGMYRHMVAYRNLAQENGFSSERVVLVENGQEVIFTPQGKQYGRKVPVRNVLMDEVSGEEVEHYVLHDREKLAKEGMVIMVVQFRVDTGKIAEKPVVITRGFLRKESQEISRSLARKLQNLFAGRKPQRRTIPQTRKLIEDLAKAHIQQVFRREPLVLGVVIEV
jgi:ribonuclease J